MEFIKVTACLLYLIITKHGFNGLIEALRIEIVEAPMDSLIYVIQNNLLFIAVSNLDPGTYQVTCQLKTPITALFAMLLMRVKDFFSRCC